MAYFDCNATASLTAAGIKTWEAFQQSHWHNPGSPCKAGARAYALLQKYREELARYLRCDQDQVLFNSGATEGNYSLLMHYYRKLSPDKWVGVSAIEHPSVYIPARELFAERCMQIPVTPEGVLDEVALKSQLNDVSFGLISVMAANNETGVVQPWQKVAELCREQGIPYHLDASQWLGKLPANELGLCDYITGCAHKFGGPKGVGFFKTTDSYAGYSGATGGAQEHGLRAGTEDLPGVAAMLTVLKEREATIEFQNNEWSKARTDFEVFVKAQLPRVQIVGEGSERLANTVLMIMPDYANTRWVLKLDQRGFQVSTGAACSSANPEASHVLLSMGYEPDEAQRAIRISADWSTARQDWAALGKALLEVWAELESESSKSAVIRI